MTKLLHIDASPRGARSHSRQAALAFIEAYRQRHPDHEVETLDLWSVALPRFDGHVLEAKYALLSGQAPDPAHATAWQAVIDVFEHFKSADKLLLSVPMWNFGVPYVLKHYIDVITQPGLAFGYSAEQGYFGLMTGRKAVIVYASGAEYTAENGGATIDFQRPYLEWWLRFIGIVDVSTVVSAPTVAAPADVASLDVRARTAARALATGF